MNAAPPNGVIAPSARTPVRASTYSDPENRTIPATNSQPASDEQEPDREQREAMQRVIEDRRLPEA